MSNNQNQAATGIPTWQARAIAAGYNIEDRRHFAPERKALFMADEIADLRAQLARQGQGEIVGYYLPGPLGNCYSHTQATPEYRPAYAAPAPASAQPDRGAVPWIERAADMLEGYAKYLYRVQLDEIEEHPYIPSIEETAAELRALAAQPVAPLAPVSQQGAQAQWISVEDERKPEARKPVLLFVRTLTRGYDDEGRPYETEGAEVAMGEYRYGASAQMSYFDCYTSPMSDNDWITHWMPLPEAPEQPHSTATEGANQKGGAA